MTAPAGTPETLVLGIETSCDETAAAVVARAVAPDGRITGRIVSNVVRSQWAEHRPFGGVVPEIAARAHVECLDDIVRDCLREAGIGFPALAAVAVTAGPGLVGGLMVGVLSAEAIAAVHRKPLIAVNHLAAHALTVGLTDGLRPPYLMLLVSGGHTQVLLVEAVDRFRRIATTIDDALGEAFDKTAKLLGLGFPGGPAVERWAMAGDPRRFAFPRPMAGRDEPHFSFAGLKTAVRLAAEAAAPLSDRDVADICASFQAAVAATVADRVRRAIRIVAASPAHPNLSPSPSSPRTDLPNLIPSPLRGGVRGGGTEVGGGEAVVTTHASQPITHLVVAGGVAANQALASALRDVAAAEGYTLHVPPPALCTDNGAMIAWAGAERLALGLVDAPGLVARARWPLDDTATAVLGSGRLGAKA